MKKLLFVFALLAASFAFVACSDDDDEKTIGMNELPTNAKTFLETHFPGQEANRVEKDNDGYEVYLKNGFSIDFTLDGEWDDVDGNTQNLPQSIVDLLPAKITEYIKANYPNESIREINKERFGYEVDLSNRVELEFDNEGNFIRVDIDDDDDINIDFKDLPATAKTFLETHFPGQTVNRVEKDNDGYEVYLKNGFSIDFTLDGEWDDVDGNTQNLPQSIIDLLPAKITEYIKANYPNESIREINKERFGYEVDLSNKVELEFDSEGNFIKVDK